MRKKSTLFRIRKSFYKLKFLKTVPNEYYIGTGSVVTALKAENDTLQRTNESNELKIKQINDSCTC